MSYYPLTDVRHFQSSDPGAPPMDYTAGSLFAVLEACLINGYGSFSPDSVVAAGGWATITKSTGHNFRDAVVVVVAGASESDFNGVFRVERLSSTELRYPVNPSLSGAASGPVTVKMAPQGSWEVCAESGDPVYVRLYRSTHPLAFPDRSLAVLDTDNTSLWANCRYGSGYWTQWYGLTGYAINAGGIGFHSGSNTLLKARTAAQYPWRVVCDSRAIYFQTGGPGNSGTTIGSYPSVCFFGDAVEAPDNQCVFSSAMGQANTNLQYTSNGSPIYRASGYSSTAYGLGMYDSAVTSVIQFSIGSPGTGSAYNWQGSTIGGENKLPYPLPGTVDGVLISRAPLVRQNSATDFGGFLPGMYMTPQYIDYFNTNTPILWAEKNKLLLALKGNSPAFNSSTYYPGGGFVDLIGPWR